MGIADKIVTVQTLSGETDEIIVNIYLELALRAMLDRLYPFSTSEMVLPAKYDMLQCEIATFLLNKRGAEGQNSMSEGGISRGYENAGIPNSLLGRLTPFVGIVASSVPLISDEEGDSNETAEPQS